jgi:hypothetical protein
LRNAYFALLRKNDLVVKELSRLRLATEEFAGIHSRSLLSLSDSVKR